MTVFDSTIDREQIDGAFALAVDVRFDDLAASEGQTVFHLSSADGLNTVTLAQVGTSADLAFIVVTNGVEHRVVAEDALSDGEYATFRVGVDPFGTMRISKNTDLLIEVDNGPGAVPLDVDRVHQFGEAVDDGALVGDILNLKLVNYGDVNALDPQSSESPCALTGEAKCLCDKLLVEDDVARGEDGPLFMPTFDAEGDGEFSSVQSLGSIPVHAMLLPDGKVLSFGVGSQGNRGDAQFVYSIYDPVTGIDTVLENTTSVDLFCSNMSLDPVTGNVLIMGSGDFKNDAVVFDYATQTIRDADHGDMVHDRWYGQSVTMANGEIFIIGGAKTGGGGSDTPEVWNSETGWRELTDAVVPGIGSDWWYPHTFVNSRDEIIILDAQGRDIHRVTTEGTGTVEKIGTLPFGGDNQQVSIMFESDKIARIDNGGGLWVIDISEDVPTYEKVADLGSNRHDGGMIALPDGTVLIVGGQTGGAWNRVENAEYGLQIWDPQTNEVIEVGEDLNIARLYHSTYVMLPDGTIWIGGGGVAGAINNANFEIYAPAYLFDENGDRIVQTEIDAPSNIEAGDTFQITVEDSADVARLTATKAGAWTHARNSDSRFLELEFSVIDATTIEVRTPAETIMGPGAWTVYTLDGSGVPSMGDIVGVNMAPLVETDHITSQAEVYGIDDDQIDGAFEIKVDVRFDDLAADVRLDGRDASSVADNAGQVVFDIGNGSEDGNRMQGSDLSGVIDYFYSDNIVLWQVGRSADMAFSVFDGDQEYRIVAEDVLIEGELATWTVGVDDAGMMRLWKDDILVAEGQGVVPNDVERKVVKVGESSWDIANDLRGKVANLEIVNSGDEAEFVHLGLPKANLSAPRYITDSEGDVQKIVFDLVLDTPAFAVVAADVTIDGPASGAAQVVIPAGGTSAQIVLDYDGVTWLGETEPVTLTLSGITQARAGSTLTSTTLTDLLDPSVVETVYLSDLDTLAEVGIHRGLLRDVAYYGGEVSMDRTVYDKTLTITPTTNFDETYADFAVTPGADVFRATIGSDDARGLSASRFEVYIDGEQVLRQFLFTNASRTVDIEFDVKGASVIRLQTAVGLGNGPIPVFADARFETFGPPDELPDGTLIQEDFRSDVSDWTAVNAGGLLDSYGALVGGTGNSGGNGDGSLARSVATQTGETYTLEFDYTFRSASSITGDAATLEVLINGVVVETFASGARVQDAKVVFTASRSWTEVEFRYTDNPDSNVSGAVSIGDVLLERTPVAVLIDDDFRNGLSDWTVVNAGELIDQNGVFVGGAGMTAGNADGSLSQQVETQAGEAFTVTFDYAFRGAAGGVAGVGTLQVVVDGEIVESFESGGDPGRNIQATFIANSATSTIEFRYVDNPESAQTGGVSVNNVLLKSVEPPVLVQYLSDLTAVDVGPTHRDLGLMRDIDYFGDSIDLGGITYDKGVMVVPRSDVPAFVTYDINGAEVFKATIGIEDLISANGAVAYSVELDGAEIYNSGRLTYLDDPIEIALNVAGGSELKLVVDSAGWNNSDHPVWADARLEYAPVAWSEDTALTLHLSDLDAKAQGGIHRGLKLDEAYIDGGIDLGGVSYAKGLSTHAGGSNSFVEYDISGADRFESTIGIEDWVTAAGTVAFKVIVDGVEVYTSGRVTHTDDPIDLNIDVSGGSVLRLVVDSLGTIAADHAVWADARLTYDAATLAGPRPGVVTFDGSQYELGTAGLSWEEARAEAEAKGGQIVEIGSAAEDQFIFKTFGDTDNPLWLGLSDTDGDGQFVGQDGGSPEYTNWAPDTLNTANADYAAIVGQDDEWRSIDGTGNGEAVLVIEYDLT